MSKDNEEQDAEYEHEHCVSCVKSACKVRSAPPFSCHMVSCQQHCGLSFHACKLIEHQLLCPLEKVPCINFTNGCPITLHRFELGRHLQRCPASVVQCTMEWNRWPVYSRERQSRVPFVHDNIHARYGQLDVALALRDQRMLNEAMKAPRSTRRALRNHLTERFPAVPIVSPQKIGDIDSLFSQSNETSQTVSDDDSDAPWEIAKNPPGLQRSVYRELVRTKKLGSENLSVALRTALNVALDEIAPSITEEKTSQDLSENRPDEGNVGENSESEEKVGDIKYTYGDNAQLESDRDERMRIKLHFQLNENDEEESSKPFIPEPPVPSPSFTLKEILALDLNLESITRYQAKPKSMYTFLCAQEFRRDEYMWHFKNVHNDIHAGLNGWLEQRCPLAHYGCTFSIRRFYPDQKGDQVVYNNILESFGVKPKVTNYFYSNCDESGDKLVEKIREFRIQSPSLGLKSRQSTPEIYTSKDYDSVVQVNGRISQTETTLKRESVEKQISNNMDATTVQKEQTEDCDISSSSCEPLIEKNPDLLTSLPFEILQHITRFLDGYSMCNLALTSKVLRDVACSLLEEKGIVVQQWQQERIANQNHWFIGYKRWKFSTSFDPVHHWGFEDNAHISEHLKVCPFYRKTSQLQPQPLPSVSLAYQHSADFQKIMHRMYPGYEMEDFTGVTSDENITSYTNQIKHEEGETDIEICIESCNGQEENKRFTESIA